MVEMSFPNAYSNYILYPKHILPRYQCTVEDMANVSCFLLRLP